MYSKEQLQEGCIWLVNKPLGWSSFQALHKIKIAVRKKWGIKLKIGHAGTLDPLATGLLLVCTGKFTKKISEFQELSKEYRGVFMLGATTASYDLETPLSSFYETKHITDVAIYEAVAQLLGEIEQTPPVFSALKKDGKRLYEWARKGVLLPVASRRVRVLAFDVTAIRFPEVHVRVLCSKGTYIRSLAHDVGKALNSGAYLSALERTKIGSYSVEEAVTPEILAAQLGD